MKGFVKTWVVTFLLLGLLAGPACATVIAAPAINPGVIDLLFNPVEIERDIPYCNYDATLAMDIYYPREITGALPAIVYIHGGGWYSGDKDDDDVKEYVKPLVDQGYVVAAINYRLAPRYQFPAQIEDVKCAVRFLRANDAKYHIDPDNIGAMGDSAGGHLAALLGATGENVFEKPESCCEQSDGVKAVVDLYGPTDLPGFLKRSSSLLFIETIFGTDDPMAETIKEASPVTYVTPDCPSFLIIQGEKDDTVLPEQSEELYQRLLSAGVSASLVMVENAGHGLMPVGGDISPTRPEITSLILAFFDQQLKRQ